MRAFLETPRLGLREAGAGDAEAFHQLDGDASVMRYIADGAVGTREAAAAAVARAMRYYALYPGLGKWVAEERSSGRFVGWFSLNYVPKTVEVEVGYRLLPSAWGRGLATEGARALVRHGFDSLGLYRIIGLTHAENFASQRVLQKAGLRPAGTGRYYDRELRLFVAPA